MHATGEFEVELRPLENYASGVNGITLGRMSIDKTFSGDLTAVSQGEMLTAMTAVEGSAGYVAIEQVDGNLAGKSGQFVLQHYGLTHQGNNRLTLQVIPDSGTGGFQGISGQMSIEITDGKHLYDFEYEIAS